MALQTLWRFSDCELKQKRKEYKHKKVPACIDTKQYRIKLKMYLGMAKIAAPIFAAKKAGFRMSRKGAPVEDINDAFEMKFPEIIIIPIETLPNPGAGPKVICSIRSYE